MDCNFSDISKEMSWHTIRTLMKILKKNLFFQRRKQLKKQEGQKKKQKHFPKGGRSGNSEQLSSYIFHYAYFSKLQKEKTRQSKTPFLLYIFQYVYSP